jgi:uncharacterized repeat protein (TIGR02543 family)
MSRLLNVASCLLAILLVTTVLTACGSGSSSGDSSTTTFTVTYSGNGATGGIVPTDPANYTQGQTVTVLGNSGSLVISGYSFAGWNTKADGSGTTYTEGQTLVMGQGSIMLYAMWTASSTLTYTVTYSGNDNTGGWVPTDGNSYHQGQTVTVFFGNEQGNLVKTGYFWAGWNTKADGSGTTYTKGQTFTMGAANVILYAKWTANSTYTIAYYGNGNTGGSVPADSTSYEQGQTVTVLGNPGGLTNAGYSFLGWNTKADGSGTTYMQAQSFTMGAASVSLYAMWAATGAKYAYVTNASDGTVSQYTIGANGAPLTPMTPATVKVAGGGSPNSIAVDPTGKYAYVASEGGPLAQYTIGANGTLTAMTPATVTAGANSDSITVDPSGKYVYVANEYNDAYAIFQFTIGATGALTAMSPVSVEAGSGSASITISPSGTYAYVANSRSNSVSQYTIGPTGGLMGMTPAMVAAGTGPRSVAVDASGRYAYVANSGDSTISQYTIGATGALTSMTAATVAAGLTPNSVTVDPTGKYVYVANVGSTNISQYTIGANGALASLATSMTLGGVSPWSVTVDSLGKYVYVANRYSNTVSEYMISATGVLTLTTNVFDRTGTDPTSVAVVGIYQ